MGSLYRSEPMTLCQLFLQPESAYSCISELGELGLVQFKDLNRDVNSFQRKYVNEVRRCEEMERKLRFLESEIKKDGIKIPDTGDNPDAPATREMTDIEANLERLENEMKEVNTNYETLKRNFSDLTELKHILSKTNNFFDEPENATIIVPSDGDAIATAIVNLGFVAGVIMRDRLPAFERMLWRACRGNVLLRHTDIDQPLENPSTGVEVYKSVFLIFFQGDQLKLKVKKICEGFHGTVYPCPETQTERREMAMGVVTRIEDLKTVLSQTEEHRYRVLSDASSRIRVWTIKVRKMKAIFHTMNQFSGGSGPTVPSGGAPTGTSSAPRALIGECWCPVKHLDRIQLALRRGTERSGSGIASILNMIEANEMPPTYNETNKFTEVFQGIIDSYGVATYQEINPAPFTIITFPFLFSVMFGDAGHGVIVFLAALTLVLMEKRLGAMKSDNEIWNIFFGGRYIILLMGAFSIYSGMLYNDIFAKSFNIFGSAWTATPQRFPLDQLDKTHDFTLDPTNNTDYRGHPYPFGMDPIWSMSMNKISFLNSFKMKISVVFGIGQMLFGVILSLLNHRFNGDIISIVCEFIPQMLFLLSIFGYLIVLIFYKWIVFDAATGGCAPSLLIDLINMFLLNYPDEPCSVQLFYKGQKQFQIFLLLMVVICIPWLLIPKPFLLKRQHNMKMRNRVSNDRTGLINDGFEMQTSAVNLSVQSGDIVLQEAGQEVVHHGDQHGGGGHGGHGEEFDFGEVFVHQCIHTIEYCLGCISHTASYLRLWALSLAHAELSEVLWTMVLHTAFTILPGYPGCFVIFVIFTPWAVLTVAILLLMEGLSAFLHTLRLHWVEFQSKFYKGEGYMFEPLSFKHCLSGSLEDEAAEKPH